MWIFRGCSTASRARGRPGRRSLIRGPSRPFCTSFTRVGHPGERLLADASGQASTLARLRGPRGPSPHDLALLAWCYARSGDAATGAKVLRDVAEAFVPSYDLSRLEPADLAHLAWAYSRPSGSSLDLARSAGLCSIASRSRLGPARGSSRSRASRPLLGHSPRPTARRVPYLPALLPRSAKGCRLLQLMVGVLLCYSYPCLAMAALLLAVVLVMAMIVMMMVIVMHDDNEDGGGKDEVVMKVHTDAAADDDDDDDEVATTTTTMMMMATTMMMMMKMKMKMKMMMKMATTTTTTTTMMMMMIIIIIMMRAVVVVVMMMMMMRAMVIVLKAKAMDMVTTAVTTASVQQQRLMSSGMMARAAVHGDQGFSIYDVSS